VDQSWQAPNGSLTVAVTGANSLTGKTLLQRLKGTNARVIALVRSPIELPAEQVISDWVSAPEAMQAMQNADIVVHLSGELFARGANPYYAANVQTAQAVAQALHQGHTKRVLFLSYVGADATSANLYLRTKGQAEQLLLKSGKAIVFRCPAMIMLQMHLVPKLVPYSLEI
jgi:NADH dehydrogenase